MSNYYIHQAVCKMLVICLFSSQVNHAEHTTTCLGEVYTLDFNMAGRSEDESVSNSSGESRYFLFIFYCQRTQGGSVDTNKSIICSWLELNCNMYDMIIL